MSDPHQSTLYAAYILGAHEARDCIDLARMIWDAAVQTECAEHDALKRRFADVMPLFEEARDALTAIPLASARLHNVRLDLADRMDRVGIKAEWDKMDRERAIEQERGT